MPIMAMCSAASRHRAARGNTGLGLDADCAQNVVAFAGACHRRLTLFQRVDRPVPNIYRDHMNVDLTPDQRALVKRAIDSGRFSHEEEAVQEALALWEERERRRVEILASLEEAEASLARGEGRPITEESMKALAEDVKQRGRARLAAERNASH